MKNPLSKSSEMKLKDKILELESKNKSLGQQNLDLQKKIDILEETVNYYKTALNDSQKSIQEVSEYSKKLDLEKTRLLNKITKLESKK